MRAFNVNDLRRLIREAFGNAYKVLGVSPNATPEEIKSAFRRLLIQNHPDRNPGVDTTAKMAQINVANSLLSDPEKRKRYDQFGDKTIDADPSAPRPQQSAPPRPEPKPYNPPPPRQRPNPGSSSSEPFVQRTFYYSDLDRGGNSNKFWQVTYDDDPNTPSHKVLVRWGRRGTTGARQIKYFQSYEAMKDWISMKIRSQLNQGYVEQARPGSSQQSSAPPPKAKRPEPTGKARASKKTYKIYGSKRGKPIHTRVGGRVYVPQGTSKFSKGDNPEVSVGSDGRASVMDPKSGHTQTWDGFDEVKKLVDDLVIESLVCKFNDAL